MKIQLFWSKSAVFFLSSALLFGAAGPKAKPPVKTYDITGHLDQLSADFRGHVTLSGNRRPSRTTAAQADGTFAFRNVPPGSYTVRPKHGKFTFTPSFHTVAITDHDRDHVDFTAHPRGGAKKR
jgi:hypothetical protein